MMSSELLVVASPVLLRGMCFATAVPTNFIEASAAAAGEAFPKAQSVAYSGGPMELGYGRPVYPDLAGMEIPTQEIAVLRQHDHKEVLGQTTRIGVVDSQLTADWTVSGSGPYADVFREDSKRGIKSQASIGFWAKTWERIDAGQTATVNGRQIEGPAYIVRKSMVGELSMVPWGADHKTSNKLAAAAGATTSEEFMRLNSQFFDPTPAGGNGAPAAPAAPITGASNPAGNAAAGSNGGVDAEIAERRMKIANEERRVTSLRDISAKFPRAERNKPGMLASAIAEGWEAERYELEAMRADRHTATQPPAPEATIGGHGPMVLQAAIAQCGNLPNVDKHFDEQSLTAARKAFPRGVGLRRLVEIAARARGFQGDFGDDHDGCLRAAFSTSDFGAILTNVQNKFLLEGYNSVDASWRAIAKVGPLSDLKPHTRLRLTTNSTAERVNDGGEIKHGTIGNESYTVEGDTFGKMLAITRKSIINDDTGALSQIPFELGMGQADALSDAIWTLWLANKDENDVDFFSTDRKNYKAGATTTLDREGLRQAVQMFADQTKPNGKPLGIMPSILLVPTALAEAGQGLFKTAEFRDTTANKIVSVANIYQGTYRPVVCPYLGNSTFSGYSAAAWWLLADPLKLPTLEVGFLGGIQAPTIERTDADFDTLGIKVRTFWDWGIALANYRGGVKMKGAA